MSRFMEVYNDDYISQLEESIKSDLAMLSNVTTIKESSGTKDLFNVNDTDNILIKLIIIFLNTQKKLTHIMVFLMPMDVGVMKLIETLP